MCGNHPLRKLDMALCRCAGYAHVLSLHAVSLLLSPDDVVSQGEGEKAPLLASEDTYICETRAV